jgi:hypothetical protein
MSRNTRIATVALALMLAWSVPALPQSIDPDHLTEEQAIAALQWGHNVHKDELPAFNALTQRFRFLLDSLQDDSGWDRKTLTDQLIRTWDELRKKTSRKISLLVITASAQKIIHMAAMAAMGQKLTGKDVDQIFAIVMVFCEDKPSDCESPDYCRLVSVAKTREMAVDWAFSCAFSSFFLDVCMYH